MKVGELAISSAIGGTVEEIRGGKFANGAITSAFSMLFNDMMHRYDKKGQVSDYDGGNDNSKAHAPK